MTGTHFHVKIRAVAMESRSVTECFFFGGLGTLGWVSLHGLRGIIGVFIATPGPAGEVLPQLPDPLGKHCCLGWRWEEWGIRCQDESVSTGLLIPPGRVASLGSRHLFQHGGIWAPHSLCKWYSVAVPNTVWWHYLTGKNGILADSKTFRKQVQSVCIASEAPDMSTRLLCCSIWR